MQTCPGCGAFYNKKCVYCGYESKGESWIPYDFVNLHVRGNMNDVKVKYGKQTRDNIFITGNMQDAIVYAERINVDISGNMNDVKIEGKVEYAPIIKGNMNDISHSR